MASLRLTRICASVLRPALEQTVTPCNAARRTIATSATRFKREIQVLEPDKDENQTALTTTDKRGKLAVSISLMMSSEYRVDLTRTYRLYQY